MTLLFTESWDLIGNPDLLATYGKWIDIVHYSGGWGAGWNSFALETGRYGGSCVHLRAGNNQPNSYAYAYATLDLGAVATTLFIGMGFMTNNFGNYDNRVFQIWDASQGVQIDLRVLSTYQVQVTRSGTILCTTTTTLPIGVWVYLELGVRIDPANGWAELRIDQVLQASYYGNGNSRASANGNTRATANPGGRFFRFGAGVSIGNFNPPTYDAPDFKMDDVVIYNDQGTVNNNFLGDTQITGLLPNAAGNYTQLNRGGTTPSATNWQSVDEATPNDDVDYVYGNLLNYTDTYGYPDLPGEAAQVRAVVFQPIIRKDSSGYRAYRPYQRLPQAGGVPMEGVLGTDRVLSSSYRIQTTIAELKVDGTAWVQADVNQAEFGVRITA